MFVPIGGIQQWITIEGADQNCPVILFLHGGPGAAASPVADALYAGWDKQFTLVQWDQRGAGRTYSKNGDAIEPSMTIDRMVQDGIEVSEFVVEHLHKKKIIIVGGSWGSVLGASMAHARPDLYYAYIGSAQIVNWEKDVEAGYGRVVQLAREAGDQNAITALNGLGPPPWNNLRNLAQYLKWARVYEAKTDNAPLALNFSPEYASPEERKQYAAAGDFSFVHFFGVTLSGPLTKVDLTSLGTGFSIPIFIVQGQ